MSNQNTIIRFENVSFSFNHNKIILDEVSFSVRSGMKVALMGQNGAGKSTLFQLLTGAIKPDSGEISVDRSLTIATAYQVIPPADLKLTVLEYFKKYCPKEDHEVKKRIAQVLDAVNLKTSNDKLLTDFSGGQQARLLLAAALIQDPDLLLLDEPTNNLDFAGIEHLTNFLVNYQKSVVVISHDANFLNTFTKGVLYLDSFTKKIEQYAGDYYDVVEEIAARIEKENRLNAQKARGIQENKDKANFFAHKGGKMRKVAKKMREKIELFESEKVDVRKEDRTIKPFKIPVQKDFPNDVMKITSFTIMDGTQRITKPADIILMKKRHLQIIGPNGIGKSTLIESMAKGTHPGLVLPPSLRVGYYRQDFSTLNFEDTVYQALSKALQESGDDRGEEYLRSVASGFLIDSHLIKSEIGSLSEGQKGLVAFARLVLLRPGLLILDEPTNHINFRHLPIIATALNDFEGAMILVSHVDEFVWQIQIDDVLDLER
ncbi:ABC-F family ATP-binding cassette domain-containing protein [Candidatus Woesebacteria bacterium]|nr:ABC-F family ATP-binding cassette domain-containing protein [Candidatus Woesebacteria bacterium]